MRFAAIVDVLCTAVAARGGRGALAGPLTILLWTRLRRAVARFRSLVERIEAGTLRPPRPDPRRNRIRPRAGGGAKIPQRFAWLLAPVPEASCSAGQLREFFADPETAALLQSDPRFGRILRPLCRTIGLRPPQGLALPRRKPRPRRPRPAPAEPEPAPSPYDFPAFAAAMASPEPFHPPGHPPGYVPPRRTRAPPRLA